MVHFCEKISLLRASATLMFVFFIPYNQTQAAESPLNLVSTWAEPSPTIAVRGAEQSSITSGSLIRYAITSEREGYCSLLKRDSAGNYAIWLGDGCAPEQPPVGSRTLVPTTQPIEYYATAGNEVISVVITAKAVSLPQGLSAGEGWVELAATQLDELEAQFSQLAGGNQLSLATTSYTVAEGQDDLQFTTRAILRQVSEAENSAREDGYLTTFSVDAIRFQFGTANPTPAGMRQLDAFGEALQDPMLATKRVIVAGHTDDVGDKDFNLELAKERSVAVRDYFARYFNVNPERIEVEAYGESRPQVPNSSEENRARNRRVDITFLH